MLKWLPKHHPTSHKSKGYISKLQPIPNCTRAKKDKRNDAQKGSQCSSQEDDGVGGATIKPETAGIADMLGLSRNLARFRILGLFLTRF